MRYRLKSFEGPLDLLLHLIEANEIDIYDIPISEITDQYLAYLDQMDRIELDSASEFLVMAATLLEIKSKMLLPPPPVQEPEPDDVFEEGPDPRAELVRQLLEYRKYKRAAEVLKALEDRRALVCSREPADLSAFLSQEPDEPLRPAADPVHLWAAFRRVMRNLAARRAVATVRRDDIPVRKRMWDILRLLREHGRRLLFSRLLGDRPSRMEVVATFLAVLELAKRKAVGCSQERLFGEIVLWEREGARAFELFPDEIDY